MPWPTERQRPHSRFGTVCRAHMERVGLTTSGMAHRLQLKGRIIHPTGISHYMSSDRIVSPKLVNQFAKALDLDPDQTTELHQAAALDYGYEIGEE